MNKHAFAIQSPKIDTKKLRDPQSEAYYAVKDYFLNEESDRETGIILPVGCGKSGLITILPFSIKSKRSLVVAPNVKIAGQLYDDFDMSNPDMFYTKCSVLTDDPFPEPVEIRGDTINRSDLDNSDVAITNIQQLQGNENKWLKDLPADYFDLIIFDEAHHNVAASWEGLRNKFPSAKIVNLSATPMRSDGQMMYGDIIYSYPIFKAIEKGYVKKLKAVVLNLKTLKYVRNDGNEVEVPLEEVRRLGEEDADFRRSIVTSKETLDTIVDASIRELNKIRKKTSDNKHKIIAAALNYEHCIQITAAYRARNLRAEYVHSRENSIENNKILAKLKNNEIDVIVQVRKLGEGFDHPFLSVAAVFSVFTNLSPFIQFVGRIMRVIEQNNPKSIQNHGTVIFHAGANIAKRWEDFQQFSQADQDYFDQLLLPTEEYDFENNDEIEYVPNDNRELKQGNNIEITDQKELSLEEIPLIFMEDEETKNALEVFIRKGISLEDYKKVLESHQPIRVPLAKQRQANRKELDELVKNEVGKILLSRKINPQGYNLDKQHLHKTNFVILKSSIDKKIMQLVKVKSNERNELSSEQLQLAKDNLSKLCSEVIREVL